MHFANILFLFFSFSVYHVTYYTIWSRLMVANQSKQMQTVKITKDDGAKGGCC